MLFEIGFEVCVMSFCKFLIWNLLLSILHIQSFDLIHIFLVMLVGLRFVVNFDDLSLLIIEILARVLKRNIISVKVGRSNLMLALNSKALVTVRSFRWIPSGLVQGAEFVWNLIQAKCRGLLIHCPFVLTYRVRWGNFAKGLWRLSAVLKIRNLQHLFEIKRYNL